MKVILFGSTGMVGKGVLRQCLLDPKVESVLSIGRSPSGVSHPKLRELVRADLFDFYANAGDLDGYNSYAQRGNLPTVEDVCEGGMALMPALGRVRMLRSWGGIMDMSMDGSPIIDHTPIPGLYRGSTAVA